MSRRTPKSDRSFGSRPAGQRGRNSVSRGQLIRERYSTDRYPTAEDFIKAVEKNPDHFDPSSENFFPHDYGNKYSHNEGEGGRGFSGTNLKSSNGGKSNWIADNPIEVDTSDPGSLSASIELYSDDKGNTVSAVAGVDLIPMGIDINGNGDVGTIGVDLGMPGDAIGVTVGASFDVNTGEVIGGELGLAGGGLSVSVNQIKKDGEICTTITVTYFGIGTAYQRCRKDDDNDEKDPPKDPPPPPGEDDLDPIPPMPPLNPLPGNPDDYVYYFFIHQSAKQNKRIWYVWGKMVDKWQHRWLGNHSLTYQNQYGQDVFPPITLTNGDLKYRFSNFDGIYCESTDSWADGVGSHAGQYCQVWAGNGAVTLANWGIEYHGKKKDFNDSFRKYQNQWDIEYKNDWAIENTFIFYSREIGNEWGVWQLAIAFVNDKKIEIQPPEPPKEPDPPIPPEDPVKCCDLEPVMSLLRKVSTAIGVDDLPANMPKSLLENKGNISIPSLAQFLAYQEDTLDQRLGKFPIEMEIIDTDPLTPGNQAKKVKLQNLAETLAELFGLAVSGANDSAIQTSASFRTLVELVTTRQTVIQNYRSIEAIMEWLGFAVSEEKEMMKSLITIPKGEEEVFEEITRYLQESEIEIKVNQLADKNNLRVELKELLHAAAIIKTLFFKKVDPNGSMKEQLKPWLDSFNPNNADTEKDWKDRIEFLLEQLAKDESGNIDKDKVAKIMNTYQLQKDE